MRFRAKNCMESGGETFYIKKETTAQSSNLESCVTTRTVDISGCGFSRARGFSREKKGRWGSGAEGERKRIKIFAKIGGGLRYRVIWLPSFKTEEYREARTPSDLRPPLWCALRLGKSVQHYLHVICMPFAYNL